MNDRRACRSIVLPFFLSAVQMWLFNGAASHRSMIHFYYYFIDWEQARDREFRPCSSVSRVYSFGYAWLLHEKVSINYENKHKKNAEVMAFNSSRSTSRMTRTLASIAHARTFLSAFSRKQQSLQSLDLRHSKKSGQNDALSCDFCSSSHCRRR